MREYTVHIPQGRERLLADIKNVLHIYDSSGEIRTTHDNMFDTDYFELPLGGSLAVRYFDLDADNQAASVTFSGFPEAKRSYLDDVLWRINVVIDTNYSLAMAKRYGWGNIPEPAKA